MRLLRQLKDPPSLLVLKEYQREYAKLTLSEVSNATDDTTASEGRLLFITANNTEELEIALTRSERIDYELEFKAADHTHTVRCVTRFCDGAVDTAKSIADKVEDSWPWLFLTIGDMAQHPEQHDRLEKTFKHGDDLLRGVPKIAPDSADHHALDVDMYI